jgi:hypothetical protein
MELRETCCNRCQRRYSAIAFGKVGMAQHVQVSLHERSNTIMANDNRPPERQGKKLPQPDVEFVLSGTPPSAMTEAGVKGILVNPLNAGAGPFPPLVSDAQWVAACKRLLEQEPPEQFLVNLLFMLRKSLDTLGD